MNKTQSNESNESNQSNTRPLSLNEMASLTYYQPILFQDQNQKIIECSVALKIEHRIKLHRIIDGDHKINDFWMEINEANAKKLLFHQSNIDIIEAKNDGIIILFIY